MQLQALGKISFSSKSGKAVSLVPGTAITIPANVKHWHGAKPYSWFSHIAVKVPGDNARANGWKNGYEHYLSWAINFAGQLITPSPKKLLALQKIVASKM